MDTVSPVLLRKRDEHWEQSAWQLARWDTSLSLLSCLLTQSKPQFSLFPWHLPGGCLFYRCSHPSWVHCHPQLAQEVGITVWTSTVQETRWELSHQLIINTRLDFLVVSSTTFTMLLIVVSPACTVIGVTKTAQCALLHIIQLVANLCFPELQKHMRQYHVHKAVFLAM